MCDFSIILIFFQFALVCFATAMAVASAGPIQPCDEAAEKCEKKLERNRGLLRKCLQDGRLDFLLYTQFCFSSFNY